MAADEATWAEVRRAYVETDETLASISDRLGVPVSTIHRHVASEDWPRRKGRAFAPRLAAGIVTVGSIEAARNDVVRRLYKRMSEKLTKMEQDTTAASRDPAADPDDRMLTALIRQFEKLTGLDGTTDRERATGKGRERQPAAGGRSAGRDRGAPEQQRAAPLDAVRIRNEIAERLEKLHAERMRKTGPE